MTILRLSIPLLLGALAEIAVAAEPIRLGVALPLGIATGRQSVNAMKLAVQEINRGGGVLGRPLEMIVADDEMNPDKGAAAIEKLAAVDKVDFFLGGIASGVHLAQIPVLKKYGKVTVWSGAASSKVERELKDQDWYFHLHTWDYQQVEQQIQAWQGIARKSPRVRTDKWFLAYEDGAYGTTMFTAYQAAFPKEWTLKGVDFKSAAAGGTADYRIALKRAQEFNPDIFLWVGYESDAFPLMAQLKLTNYRPPILAGMPPGWPKQFGKELLADGVCLYDAWQPHMKSSNATNRRFIAAYREEYKEDPDSYFPPLTYTSVHVLAEAIRRAGSTDTSAVIAALAKTRYETLFGTTLTFYPSKFIKHQGGMNILKIMQWQNGVLHVIYPFEHATARIRHPYGK
ncbi:MAG: ABC transporter substrate-binding protein [Proteobacteria bacterium]|nr:ABC transporter substrate-binding protein [Pseudomonadota bacterium]